MSDEATNRQFSDWLSSRMDQADLTAEEKKVFADWLMRETPPLEEQKKPTPGKAVTMQEVRQLFSWLKERISCTALEDHERRQFRDWLVHRVTDQPHLDHGEIDKFKQDYLK